jgi:hypothetical protein
MESWKVQIHTFLNQSQYLATRRCPSRDRTLIESIDGNADRDLSWASEHLHETLCKFTVTGWLGATMGCGVQSKRNVAEQIIFIAETELDEGR